MKRVLCSLLVATLPFGSVRAAGPMSKNAKVKPAKLLAIFVADANEMKLTIRCGN